MKAVELLYVEDNDDVRELIVELMSQEGCTVTPCASAEQALALCGERRFDLVITDVNLPAMSGTELTRQLVAADPDQWVALCSGYQYGDDARRLGRHVRGLNKPFEPEEFDALVEEVRGSLAR